MKIAIKGAEFRNKGAQALLFTTIYEIRKKFPDAEIFYVVKERPSSKIGIKAVYLYRSSFLNALKYKAGRSGKIDFFAKATLNSIRTILKGNVKLVHADYTYLKIIKELDLLLDISGYALSSAFAPAINENYLAFIDYAKACGIPVVLLPQSFGPFAYGEGTEKFMERIKTALRYPRIIFAREAEGMLLLKKEFALNNVIQSDDLVLQNPIKDLNLVCDASHFSKHIPEIKTDRNVAIVPNTKIVSKCGHINLQNLYKAIIDLLLEQNRTVYIMQHCVDDIDICKAIKNQFATVPSVILVDTELNFYEYERIIHKFDYIIASRFHSIVHAFKQNVPCLGLGWADKYMSLFQSCGQQDYILDLRGSITTEAVIKTLLTLEQNYITERTVIEAQLLQIQSNSCFDQTFAVLDCK